MIPWWRTELGEDEIRAVAESIRNRHINQGPVSRELEQRLAQELAVPHTATCTSGSAALYLALTACGVEPGDEVILPAMSFIATAHASLLRGAKLRLVDVRPDRPLIDIKQIEPAINEKTKAIIAVHLNGGACDMTRINDIAGRHGLKVIEDAAQAFASKCPLGNLGTLGDCGTFSMSIAKLMTTGEGGFIATRDEELYEQVCKLRNQGVADVAGNEFDAFGFNFRFTDVLASIGHAQLDSLSSKVDSARATYTFYRDHLTDVPYLRMMPCRLDDGEVPLWAQVFCSDRGRVIELLAEHGVQSRPLNPPLSHSPHLGASGEFPNAERLAAGMLGLPSGPHQSPDDLRRVVDALHEINDQLPPLSSS